MIKRYPTRKRIRLDRTVYENPSLVFHIIICAKNGTQPFIICPFTDFVFESLVDYLGANTFLYAACIMPDHIHLLIRPKKSNVIDIIANFKRYISNQAKEYEVHKPLWQTSFFDHVLRKREQLGQVVKYILDNPIRLRLCNRVTGYPYLYNAFVDF